MGGKKGKKRRASRGKTDYNKLEAKVLGLLDKNISLAYSAKQVAKKLKARDMPPSI